MAALREAGVAIDVLGFRGGGGRDGGGTLPEGASIEDELFAGLVR